MIRVARPLAALHALAAAWRRRFDPLTVGITGSIAKTSTKEAVAAVLATRYRTLKNEGNENNEIGLPLTVLRLGPDDEALVLEMGMYVEGEIADLVRIGRPRIGVVTAVQPVHLAADGLDRGDRAREGPPRRGPPAGTGRRSSTPTTSGSAAMADRTRRPGGRPTGFAEDADVRRRGGRVARPRRDALRAADAGRPARRCGSRCSAATRSTTRWRPRRSGWRAGLDLDDDRAGPGRPVRARRIAASSSVSAT